MKTKLIIYYLLSIPFSLIILTNGCSQPSQSSQNNSSMQVVSPTVSTLTITSQNNLAITPTAIADNPIQQSMTSTVTSIPLLTRDCFQVLDKFPVNSKPEGTLLLYPRSTLYKDLGYVGSYLFNLTNKHKTSLPGGGYFSLPQISPDNSKLIYASEMYLTKKPYLTVFSNKGITLGKNPLLDNERQALKWIDENQILITNGQKNDKGEYVSNLILYNPFKNERQTTNKSYIYNPHHEDINLIYQDIAFNDDLTYLAATWIGNNPNNMAHLGYELINMSNQQSVFLYGYNFNAMVDKSPIWVDKNHVIILMNTGENQELYLVDTNGQKNQLTFLGDQLPSGSKYYIT
jgi:hypothetical protein